MENIQESRCPREALCRFTEYFAEFAETQNQRALGPEQQDALGLFRLEFHNLAYAIEITCTKNLRAPARQLAEGLLALLDLSFRWKDGLSWYTQLGAVAEELGDPELHRWTDYGTARMLWRLGRFQEAHERLDLLASVQEPAWRIRYLGDSAYVLFQLGNFAEAERRFYEALMLAEQTHEKRYAGGLHLMLGVLLTEKGEYDRALEHHRAAEAIWSEIQNPIGRTANLSNIAILHLWTGNAEAAERTFQQTLQLCEQIGSDYIRARTLDSLGVLYSRQKRLREAEAVLQEGLSLAEAIGDLSAKCSLLINLANVYFRMEKRTQARTLFSECLLLAQELRDPYFQCAARMGLASIGLKEGSWEEVRDHMLAFLAMMLQSTRVQGCVDGTLLVAEVLHQAQRSQEAEWLARNALALARKHGYRPAPEWAHWQARFPPDALPEEPPAPQELARKAREYLQMGFSHYANHGGEEKAQNSGRWEG